MSGKRNKATLSLVDQELLYAFDEAIELVKKTATVKFDESFDIALNLGIDSRHSNQMVRGMVSLPAGTGKKVRVIVFASDNKQIEEAKAAGADIIGDEDVISTILKGDINFDCCIATPDMMPVLSKVARILGPRGLMPNIKLGTVTKEIGNAVGIAKAGQVEFRVEKAGIIHASLGKVSFSSAKLKENMLTFLKAIQKAKPAGLKGVYMKKISLSSTMGPSISLDLFDVSKEIAE